MKFFFESINCSFCCDYNSSNISYIASLRYYNVKVIFTCYIYLRRVYELQKKRLAVIYIRFEKQEVVDYQGKKVIMLSSFLVIIKKP